tara:strand:+ start:49 stop:813 length:765 start_codon:yes stop_codon:yes gene_type:complete
MQIGISDSLLIDRHRGFLPKEHEETLRKREASERILQHLEKRSSKKSFTLKFVKDIMKKIVKAMHDECRIVLNKGKADLKKGLEVDLKKELDECCTFYKQKVSQFDRQIIRGSEKQFKRNIEYQNAKKEQIEKIENIYQEFLVYIYQIRKKKQLVKEAKKEGILITGTKQDIIYRLLRLENDHQTWEDYTTSFIKDHLISHGSPVDGNRATLIKRISDIENGKRLARPKKTWVQNNEGEWVRSNLLPKFQQFVL